MSNQPNEEMPDYVEAVENYIAKLELENQELISDMALIAVSVKDSLTALGIMNPQTGEIKADGRSIARILPQVLNGQLTEKLSFLSSVVPLFDKYKHLVEVRPQTTADRPQ